MALLCGVPPDAATAAAALRPSACCCRSSEVKLFSSFCDATPSLFKRFPKLAVWPRKLRTRTSMIRASTNYFGDYYPRGPLQMKTPVGMRLTEILQRDPDLLQVEAEKELEILQGLKDNDDNLKITSSSLYKRMAEVNENDRRKILEEILYCLVVQKFVQKNISMIPKLSASSEFAGKVHFFPSEEEHDWEALYSPEVFEMIVSHLAVVLGEGGTLKPLDTVIEMRKIRLGKLYAASIMYGYFLTRVDQRLRLERSANTLPRDFGKDPSRSDVPTSEMKLWDPDSMTRIYPEGNYSDVGGIESTGSGDGGSYMLRTYVMSLNEESLQQFATMRSKEAELLIEKQTQALFGTPDIMVNDDGTLDSSNTEELSLTYLGLQTLILEAVAFGSFLLDVENFAELRYPFMKR